MPKYKSKRDSTSDSDSGPDDKVPAKKSKPEPKKAEKSRANEEEEDSWSLGKNRFIKLREFKNTWYVDIREHYNADGDLKPGKKGIMLTMEQWQKFKSYVDEIDDAIKKNV